MDKSPDAFRTISEVADWLGTPAHVLRFWESRFSQVKPVKRAGGRRYYRPSDMVLLGGIKKLLHDDGLTIRGVQKLLREHGVRYVASMSPHIDGVPPVVPLSESVGPVPAAPMAEDVPTGAFDTTPEAPEEKVVPFSRPDIPPQPAPSSMSTPESAAPSVEPPSLETQPSVDEALSSIPDISEAPMVDVDAPFEPVQDHNDTVEIQELPSIKEALDPPSVDEPAQNDLSSNTAELPEAKLSPEPAIAKPIAKPATPESAQVTFDFDVDADPAQKTDQVAAPLGDDAAFETALQDALSTDDSILDVEKNNDHLTEDFRGTDTEASPEPVPPIEVNTEQTQTPFAPADPDPVVPENITTDFPPVTTAGPNDVTSDPQDVIPDIAIEEIVSPVNEAQNDTVTPSEAFEPKDLDAGHLPENVAKNETSTFVGDPADTLNTLDDPIKPLQNDTPISTPPIIEAASLQDTSSNVIPDDLEDDAIIDVPEGVLGQLNKNALSSAEPQSIQIIFDRVAALHAKLSQTG